MNRIRCARNDPSSAERSWVYFATQSIAEYNSTPYSVTGFSPSYLLNDNSFEIFLMNLLIPLILMLIGK